MFFRMYFSVYFDTVSYDLQTHLFSATVVNEQGNWEEMYYFI